MKNSKTRVMFIMCIAMAIMAIGYAYFATNLDITATGNITTNWNVKFTSITSGNNGGTGGSNASTPTYTDTTATMSANLQVPGDYMEYDLVLKNSGSINSIKEDINAEEKGSPAIIFSISGVNEGDKLTGGASKTIKIKIEYDVNVTSQPTETTKTLTISIKAAQDTGQTITNQSPSINQPTYLSSSILRDNVAYADNVSSPRVTNSTGIDFSVFASYKNGQGLYYTSTNTENNGTTYYFRGNAANNYVKFGKYTKNVCLYDGHEVIHIDVYGEYQNTGYAPSMTESECKEEPVCIIGDGDYVVGWVPESEAGDSYSFCINNLGGEMPGDYATYTQTETDLYWEIVRINEDGSVRLVTLESMGQSEFNAYVGSSSRDNAYVGYMYGQTGSNSYQLTHANTNDSTVKTYLDNWYQAHLSSYTNLMSITAGFCNDRSLHSGTGIGYAQTYYGAYNRLVINKQPQFACPNEDHDLFTVNTSSVGNKALTYPIGLLSADEMHYTGISQIMGDSTDNYALTMTPYVHDDDVEDVYHFGMGNSMQNPMINTNIPFQVRPVINLKSTVELSNELPSGCTNQIGTLACPYIIKTN